MAFTRIAICVSILCAFVAIEILADGNGSGNGIGNINSNAGNDNGNNNTGETLLLRFIRIISIYKICLMTRV